MIRCIAISYNIGKDTFGELQHLFSNFKKVVGYRQQPLIKNVFMY